MISNKLMHGAAAAALVAAGVLVGGSAFAQSAPLLAEAPKFGSWGVDLDGMDRSVKPGDDFYKFVNGNWDAKTEIPADRSSWGGFAVLRNLSDERTRAIIEASAKQNAPAGSVAQKVGDFYASFMDEAAIEARGFTPSSPCSPRLMDFRAAKIWPGLLAKTARLGSARRWRLALSST